MAHYIVGGASSQEGIVFSSYNYRIEIKTYPKIEIGDIKPLKKGKGSETGIIFWAFIIILSLGEIVHKYIPLQIGDLILRISFTFRMIVIILLIGSIIFMAKRSGIKGFNNLRMNHGAEHKVIDAYHNGKIEDAQKFKRFSMGCGSYLVIPIIIIILLGGWLSYPFTICLLYYTGYMHVRQIRYVLYRTIGMPIQYMVTKEPTSEILNAAEEGLSKLIYEEKVRDVAQWCLNVDLKKRYEIKNEK
jgi:uncharacterized protein YqhQ